MKKAIIVGMGTTAVFLVLTMVFKLLVLTMRLYGYTAGIVVSAITCGVVAAIAVYVIEKYSK